jgi:hypothetical protein
MVRGRPKGDEPTCVLAVRVSIALREQLDRYLDALETRIGLKASRTEIIRHALRRFLAANRTRRGSRRPQASASPECIVARAPITRRRVTRGSPGGNCQGGAPSPWRSAVACTGAAACAKPL